jgi:hypothetical protein
MGQKWRGKRAWELLGKVVMLRQNKKTVRFVKMYLLPSSSFCVCSQFCYKISTYSSIWLQSDNNNRTFTRTPPHVRASWMWLTEYLIKWKCFEHALYWKLNTYLQYMSFVRLGIFEITKTDLYASLCNNSRAAGLILLKDLMEIGPTSQL